MHDESQELGKRLIRVLIVALVFVVGMCIGGRVLAETYMVKDPLGNTLKIYDRPCTDGKVLAFIAMRNGRPYQFKDGEMMHEGKHYIACWVPSEDGYVYVIADDGDILKIPMEMFQRVTDV
jgi:hypothetical protein